MKEQIESLKATREQLISKYDSYKKEQERFKDLANQSLDNDEYDAYRKNFDSMLDMREKRENARYAINDISNAIYYLTGEEQSTFFG